MPLTPVYLKKREEKRLRSGHPWLYSNEVDASRSPLGDFSAGQTVEVRSYGNDVVGYGYINPRSLICVRLLTRGDEETDISALITRQIGRAHV